MADTIAVNKRHGREAIDLNTYFCKYCKFWHVGTDKYATAKRNLEEAIENVKARQEELDDLPEHLRDMFPRTDRFK